eukprot:CAMPEP_0181312126 /NCGR_PEP_ID=MMETSP1101-20121128/13521_1 /TAXON_ID=46948 /ORGANISM="Rhodomonas abbreviata, Strain Caron Lab Isolate" /LENGTH=39 /DNA_ID= /DNA_START= /DNA_END= /DNA_ORIENTATION=
MTADHASLHALFLRANDGAVQDAFLLRRPSSSEPQPSSV